MKTFLAFLLLITSAHSAVIYSGLQNISLPFNSTGVYVNLSDASTSTSQPAGYLNGSAPWLYFAFGGIGIGSSPLVRTSVVGPMLAGMEQVENLAYGSLLGSGSRFSIGSGGYNGSETHLGSSLNQFQLNALGFFGFEFQHFVGGPSFFGVARITVANDGVSARLHDWSYENDPGAAIAVPEPSRTLFACIAITAVIGRRRRP